MRVAIIQDELVRKGGAEQVVLSFAKAFPDAPIYTLSYNAESTYPEFKNFKIVTSWFGKFIKNDKNLKRFFFPFGVWAMKSLKIKDYDVVLLSTTHCAKYSSISNKSIVITYCHTPFRLVFRPDSYDEVSTAHGLKAKLLSFVIGILKKIDINSARRTDYFLTNSNEVVPRIIEAYKPDKPVTVINPPVKCQNFFISDDVGDYYLLVSRFEPYKRVDLVIQAFNLMKDKKLVIIGKGSLKEELRALAENNIQFKEGLTLDELAAMYSGCKALIFPQYEDYGITPLEANAAGRPVIAYGLGGVLDTMIPYKNDASVSTAIFFSEQSVSSLVEAISLFETLKFNPSFIRAHAETFGEDLFIAKLKNFINNKYNEAKKNEQ